MDKLIGHYRFNMNHLLGRGAYGVVFKGKSQQGIPVAVKMIDRRLINKENEKHFKNEVESMRCLKHPNIVRLLDYYETQNNIYIISEYCDGGDLRDLIKQSKQDCQTVVNILKQILNGYGELQSKSIIHRDLKPANILIHSKTIKIADFGFSKRINLETDLMNSVAGTPLYMAPQTVLRQPYSAKCDIWSLGMILYELLFQKPPIKAQNILELQEQIKFPIVVPKIENTGLQNLIQKCLIVNEDDRINWDEIYSHEIFGENDYYMQQIDHLESDGQINQDAQVVYDYQKLMIQNYLQIEFENNQKVFLNIVNTARSLFNFTLYLNLQQNHDQQACLIVQYLQQYAIHYLNILENPQLFKEYNKFLQTEQGLQCQQQYKYIKQAILEKVPYSGQQFTQQTELLNILEFANTQITQQSAQMSHPRLCFLLLSKCIIELIKYEIENPNKHLFQLLDIAYIDQLPDQEIAYRITQI